MTDPTHPPNPNSEARFRMLVETMSDGLSEIDQNGIATYANSRLCEMWGYSREEIIGRSVFTFLDDENRQVLKRELAKRKKGVYSPYELVWTRKDGKKNSYPHVTAAFL